MKNGFWRWLAIANLIFMMVAMWLARHSSLQASHLRKIHHKQSELLKTYEDRAKLQEKVMGQYKILTLKMNGIIEQQQNVIKVLEQYKILTLKMNGTIEQQQKNVIQK